MKAVDCQKIIHKATQKAEELGTAMNIAVVSPSGHLTGFHRMDGAWLGSIDIAIKKAHTASLFTMNTSDIGALSKSDGPLYGIEHSNGGLITFAGGIPIRAGDTVIGAVGVSGGSVEQDQAVAEAAASILRPALRR